MSLNKETRYALDYHEVTKHSETSLLTSRHYLDFDNKPIPFKIYLELHSTSLPTSFPTPQVNALSCISGITNKGLNDDNESLTSQLGTEPTTKSTDVINDIPYVDFSRLAEILFFSAGITREIRYSYGKYYMRAASATGALYPIELYVVCDDISPNLAAGVYHFSPADFSLTELRKGKYKKYLATATSDNQDIVNSAIAIICTSIAWRNAWKYQARSYRHWFWDAGVIAANLLATTVSMGLSTQLIMGFVDDDVNNLLCLEDQQEAAVVMAAIGIGLSKDPQPKEDKQISYLPIPKIRPISKESKIEYPEIWRVNQYSKLLNKEEVKNWINSINNNSSVADAYKQSSVQTKILDKQSLLKEQHHSSSGPTLGDVILRRGS